MVLPPNRIGGIRGPSGATLDDVVAALVNLQTPLNSIAANLQDLMGDDPNLSVGQWSWEGFRFMMLYLLELTQGTFTNTDQGAAFTQDIRGWLGYHLGATPAEGAVQPGGQAAPAKLFQSMVNVDAALTSASGDTAYSRIGTLRDNSTALLQSLGTLPSSPEGETLKALLAALVECCEGGGELFNPSPPTADCLGAPGIWQECTLVNLFDQGPGGYNVYIVQFPPTITSNDDWGGATVGASEQLPTLVELGAGPYTGSDGLCFAWSFAPGNAPDGFTTISDADAANMSPAASFITNDPPLLETDARSVTVGRAGTSSTAYGFRLYFNWPTGVAANGKVWVTMTDAA